MPWNLSVFQSLNVGKIYNNVENVTCWESLGLKSLAVKIIHPRKYKINNKKEKK